MRRLLGVLLAALALAAPASAANRYVARSGGWDSGQTWSSTSCTGATGAAIPTSADDVYLCPTTTVYLGCGVAAAVASIQDEAGQAWQPGAGLVADGSTCKQGQAPSITFSGTGVNDAAQFVSLNAQGTFTLRGRRIFTNLPWGQPSDLTAGSCGTVNGTTWDAGECATYTWANQPWGSQVSTLNGTSGVAAGDIIWLKSGQWRNNFLVVIAATSNTITVGYGDPNDDKGTAGSFAPALQAARDTNLTAWDETNPTRLTATVAAGTLPGTGHLQGSCLITSNGNFYRVAGSLDGGAGTDTLILDPWMTVQVADKDSTFLATSSNAWVGPCIKPGDRFDAWDPVEVKPATPGTHRSGLSFFNGACPVLEGVYMPHATPQDDTSSATNSDMGGGSLHFYGQADCTVRGPIAQGPFRQAGTGQEPYAVKIKGTKNLTLEQISLQGFFATTGGGPVNGSVFHGFNYWDSDNLTIRASNVSFVNNDSYYMREPGSETSESDEPFEGMTVTLEGNNAHDVFTISGETDGTTVYGMNSSLNTVGKFQLTVRDNIAWNVTEGVVGFIEGPSIDYYGSASDNVFGYLHRSAEADTATRVGIQCTYGSGGGQQPNEADADLTNNVFLTSLHYASTGYSFGTSGCKRQSYSYFGEAWSAINLSSGPLTEGGLYGLLMRPGGASDTSESTQQRGISMQRDAGWGRLTIRDLVIERLCGSFSGLATAGIMLGVTSAQNAFNPQWSKMTIGMFCPEVADVACGTGFCAGIRAASTEGDNLKAGSFIKDSVFAVGDPAQGGDAWEAFPIILPSTNTGGPVTINGILCSECANGGTTCQVACCRNCTGTAYSVGSAMRDFAGPIGALGACTESDLRLRRESPAFAFGEGEGVAGARYAGIFRYSQSMRDMDIPESWLRWRASADFGPDLQVVPAAMR